MNSEEQMEFSGVYQKVVIDGTLADVTVEAARDGRFKIEYLNKGNEKQKQRYRFYSREENGVFYAGVERSDPEDKKGIFSRAEDPVESAPITLSVKLPELPEAELRTGSGDLEICDVVIPTLCAMTGSGDLTIKRVTCSNELQLQAGSGDIEGAQLSGGKLKAQTGSGDIEIAGDFAECSVQTGSGDAEVRVGAATETVKVQTGSGDADLDLNDVPGAEIHIQTGSGEAKIQTPSGKERNAYSYGDGRCKVTVQTGSGDAYVANCR